MFLLSSHINIADWQFDAVAEVEITEDVSTLTDTCVLSLPKRTRWIGAAVNAGNQPPLQRGDAIQVKLGYDGQLTEVFTGKVRSIDAQTPVTINAEDAMLLLKQSSVQKQTVTGTLGQVIEKLIGAVIPYKIPEGNTYIGKYRFTRTTIAEELDELRKDYGLKTFIHKGTLYVCWVVPALGDRHAFTWGKNIITENLTYRRKEDLKLKVKAISISDKRDVRIVEETADNGGEQREVFAYGLSRSQLKAFAEKELQRFKWTGYEGSITTFGEPVVHKLDLIRLQGSDGNTGTYRVHKVIRKFGSQGYRQEITIGERLAD